MVRTAQACKDAWDPHGWALDIAAQITPPVLGLYGETDLGIPGADVREMEALLKTAHKTAEFVLYPGAPHAFFC